MSDEVDSQCDEVEPGSKFRCELDAGHEGRHQSRYPDSGGLFTWPNKFSLEPETIDDADDEPAADDGKRCGVRDGKNGGPCIHDQGHDGHHSTGFRTFANKPQKDRPRDTESDLMRANRRRHAEARATKAASKAKPPARAAKYCDDRESPNGSTSRVCSLPPGHDGDHSNGVAIWAERDAQIEGEPKATAKGKVPKPARAKPANDDRCKAIAEGPCELKRGHEGEHFRRKFMNGWTSIATWNATRERAPAAVGSHGSGWRLCGSRWKGREDFACDRHASHAGSHAALAPERNHISRWAGDGAKGGEHIPITDFVAQLRADGSKAKATAKAKPETSPTATSTPTTPTSKAAPMTYANNKRILGYRRHPAAAVWPMLEEEELKKLVDSIKARGLDEDVVLVNVDKETWILDGSNRARACEIAGIKPRFTKYIGKKDIDSLSDYVDARNDRRRHLSKSVRAMIAAEAAKLRHGERQTGSTAGLVTQGQAAKGKGVSERLVRKAVKVRDEATPKVKEAVMRGKLTVEAAEAATRLTAKQQDELADRALAKGGEEIKAGHVRQLVRQEEKRAVVEKINKEQVHPMPIGPFRVIVVDPPWPYENADQHDGSRGHMPYPPMTIAQICQLRAELDRLVHEDGCILGMWVTNAFIHEVGRVLEAWGFTHRTMRTWDKGKLGMGTWCRGETEHFVIASRGIPVHTLNEVGTLFEGKVREHSRKPDEPMEVLEKHCPGPHIELFAREPRPNWASWGAEPRKFVGAA